MLSHPCHVHRNLFRIALLLLLPPLVLLSLFSLNSNAQSTDAVQEVTPEATPTPPPLKDLDGHFPFAPPATPEDWQRRSSHVRNQILTSQALHPMPRLASPRANLHGRRGMGDYSVERVYFESLPGFYVTGTLYRPVRPNGVNGNTETSPKKLPAVLYAHGHWDDGRFYRAPSKEVRQLLASGAERFENAAINQMQAACVQLARMGCVVFQYDMIGYADSQQISFDRAHRFGIDKPNEPTTQLGWPLYSSTAEGYNQSVMAMQTINTLQSIEFLLSLADVDPKQITITGASGGGTQSFMAIAIDPRLAGAFPAVMVSTSMQGGCTCENASGLRVGTGNVEIAALAAPRPLGLTAADDWTKNMARDGFPQLQEIYRMLGQADAVRLFPYLHFPHNYNHVSRVALYGWINQLYGLGFAEPILERDFVLLNPSDLTVWSESHPMPEGGLDFERKLMKTWAESIDKQLSVKKPTDPLEPINEETTNRVNLLKQGWRTLTRPAVDLSKQIRLEQLDSPKENGVVSYRLLDANDLTVGFLQSSHADWLNATDTTLSLEVKPVPPSAMLTQNIQSAAADLPSITSSSKPNEVRLVLHLIDPWTESVSDTGELRQRLVANPRPAAAYTYGYNPPSLLRRLGTLLAVLREIEQVPNRPIQLTAQTDEAFFPLAAKLNSPNRNASVVLQSEKVPNEESGKGESWTQRFRTISSIQDIDFLPGSLRYQDIHGLLQVVNDVEIVTP